MARCTILGAGDTIYAVLGRSLNIYEIKKNWQFYKKKMLFSFNIEIHFMLTQN